ncbi:hypothetical protein AD929_02405 [Gluconobacter potus]|uniref:Uncharacterized protein n=1 Tax=Gluconobacter potus TaxID=2724927 RepID=A0A149QYY4_9PROT|nr:type I-F CRISPR-associated protein Cas7f/Csy3 [Gluconobacter potus]KXV02523.1 hypothetical protein AD929_02405 [Gluconobacter potus]
MPLVKNAITVENGKNADTPDEVTEKKVAPPPMVTYIKSIVADRALLSSVEFSETGKETVLPLTKSRRKVRSSKRHRMQGKTLAEIDEEFVTPVNLHSGDFCNLPPEADTFRGTTSIKFTNSWLRPNSTDGMAHSNLVASMTRAYIDKGGAHYLGSRIVSGLATGSIFWRNRLGTDKIITLRVSDGIRGGKFGAPTVIECDRVRRDVIPTFAELEPHVIEGDIHAVADEIAGALSGDRGTLCLDVSFEGYVGRGQAIYPSEVLHNTEEKEKDKDKGREYQTARVRLGGDYVEQVIFTSDKIGNAIRRIDDITWHGNPAAGILPVEPYGVNLNEPEKSARLPKPGYASNFYALFDNIERVAALVDALPEKFTEDYVLCQDPSDNDVHFFFANLLFGGIFSTGKDKNKKSKAKAKK